MRQINVLIADDDKTFCDIFGRVVSNAGYNRFLAFSSEQCISILNTTKIDILFLDLRFPSINDGYEVLEFTHENYHEVEIVMLSWSDTIQDVVQTLKSGAADFIEKSIYTEQLYQVLLAKIKHLQRQFTLEDNNRDLAVKAIRMIGSSPVMQIVYDNIAMAAQFDSPVLITGETGVGKELVAKAIHKLSKNSARNLITVNCGAIPHELVESELFGCEQGAFTGALKARKGYFEYADGSTILMDEISELPFQVQVKLLRILSEGEMQKLGGKMQKVNCRVICTSNRELSVLIKDGIFREDLYYRINTIRIDVPPLRARKEDIPKLATYFLTHFCSRNNTLPKSFTPQAMQWLVEHEWNGNVRELKNAVERGVVFSSKDHVTVADLHPAEVIHLAGDIKESESLRNITAAFEKSFIYNSLLANNWNITHTAKILKIDKSNLLKKMKHYQIIKPM